MLTDAQKRANYKYRKKVYAQIAINIPIWKKDIIKEYATRNNKSINTYINIAIDRQLEIDGFKPQQAEKGKEDKNP